MDFLVGVLIFLFGIGISIGLHEIGHLVPAKRFGVRVSQYMVGFGPTIWSRVRGETEYGIKALPLGGYIRMIGMYPPANPNRKQRTRLFSESIEAAREESLAEITSADRGRSFYELGTAKKLTVMLGGPTMNLLLAAIFLSLVNVGIGTLDASTRVATVIECSPTQSNPNGITSVDGTCVGSPATAAAVAGLQPGDKLLSVANVKIESWADLGTAMSTVSQAPIEIKFIDKTGAQKSALVSATVASFQTESGEWVDRRFLGVSPELVWVKGSISQTPGILWDNSVSIVSSLASFPAEIFGLAVNLTSSEPRDESGPVSVIGIGRLTGDLAASDEYDLMSKVAITLSLLGSLNLFMFIFNLVPILPLDGGHVAGALYGGVKMAWAKIRRKPEPWPTDTAAMLPVAYVVTMGLILMSAVVILADLIKPLNIF